MCFVQMETVDRTPAPNTGQRRATETEREEFSGLFNDDDESSDDEER